MCLVALASIKFFACVVAQFVPRSEPLFLRLTYHFLLVFFFFFFPLLRNKERFLATRCCGSVGGSSWLYFTRQDYTYRHIYCLFCFSFQHSLCVCVLSFPSCALFSDLLLCCVRLHDHPEPHSHYKIDHQGTTNTDTTNLSTDTKHTHMHTYTSTQAALYIY